MTIWCRQAVGELRERYMEKSNEAFRSGDTQLGSRLYSKAVACNQILRIFLGKEPWEVRKDVDCKFWNVPDKQHIRDYDK